MALNSDDLVSADTESPKAGFDGRKILIAGGGFREIDREYATCPLPLRIVHQVLSVGFRIVRT